MEEKLAAYRKRKAKENGSSLFSLFQRKKRDLSSKDDVDVASSPAEPENNEKLFSVDTNTRNNEVETNQERDKEDHVHKSSKVLWTERILKFLLWLLLWLLFSEYQFGFVYFISSLIVIVYFNTRTGPQDRRELSAYSVFNPNFERIDGTLTAEQFEKELLYGPGSVKDS